MKKKILIILSFPLIVCSSLAQTQLSPGDLLFTGFQSGQTGQALPDRFAFLLLKSINAGTTIYFTDNAVLNQSPVMFCSNENLISWIADASVSAGTIITLKADSTASLGSVSGGLSFSQAGDQIVSFQITGSDTLCIGGFSSSGWLPSCSSGCGNTLGNNSASCLPGSLQAQINAMGFSSELNNAYFSQQMISGTPDQIRALLLDQDNWIRSDSLQTWPSWSAVITDVPNLYSESSGFLVFPNPGNGLIQVEMRQASEIRLFSLTGKELFRKAMPAGKSSLQLPVPENGLYLLRTFPLGQSILIEIFR